jgi:hypothetical protein
VSRARTAAPVVAIIDWRAAATLKDNAGFLRRAGLSEGSRSRRRAPAPVRRSLLVRADGSGELQVFTAATVARRLLAAAGEIITRKAGTGRRG